MKAEDVESIVKRCFLAILNLRGLKHPPVIDRETRIFGKDAVNDAMAIDMMLTDIESALYHGHGKSVILADDRAVARSHSSCPTVGALTDHIMSNITG